MQFQRFKQAVAKRFATKIAERDAAAAAAAKKEAKQKIMALIDQKQNEVLGAKSLDELQELLKSM